jgi:hypothetical protein
VFNERRWTKAEHYIAVKAFGGAISEQGFARFFFHLHERRSCLLDQNGIDLLTLEDVIQEAMNGARSILAAERMLGSRSVGSAIIVEDEAGRQVFQLPLWRVRAFDALSVSA